jgi:hypothetical protein
MSGRHGLNGDVRERGIRPGSLVAQPVHPARAAALRGRWLWLFPTSYALHIAEEGLAGERFYRWIGRVTGREVSPVFSPG